MATKDLAVDRKNREIFVVADSANQVDVYKLDDAGTPTAKLRSITGGNTELNGPSGVWVDTDTDELYVANGTDGKVIVFRRTDDANAEPLRVITLL